MEHHGTRFGRLARRAVAGRGVLVALGAAMLFSLACGVESGDRRPARTDEDKTGEFHRSPVAALERFSIDLEKTDAGCTAAPADVTAQDGQRIRLAVQLASEGITTTATGSTQLEGERQEVTYKVDGLVIRSSGGALGPGETEVDLELESGSRQSYDFNVSGAGEFDILCDGAKVGTFTVTG